jgi:hypothetical protein
MIDRPVKHSAHCEMAESSLLQCSEGAPPLPTDDNSAPKFAATGAAETIRVYIGEPSGPIGGVLLYYAVLAYPQASERPKRREFVEAMISMRIREYAVQGAAKRSDIPPQYRRYKREKMLSRINLGWKRVERRIHAAVMGWCIYLNEKQYPYATPTPEGKVGIILRGPNTVNDVVRAFVASRQNSSNPVHLESESAVANVMHRVWAESLPVLHIAMQNPITIKIVEAQVNFGPPSEKQIAKDLFDSVHEPSWLRGAIEDAENLKLVLPEQLRTSPDDPRGLGYRIERAIRMLTTEDPFLAYRL